MGGEEGAQGPLYIVEGGNKEKHKCPKTSMNQQKRKGNCQLFFSQLNFSFRVLKTVEKKEQSHVGVPGSLLGRSVRI